MPSITILGAGVTGMTIASMLPRHYDITIVGEHLPGDDTKEWSSPWAGAIWIGVHNSQPREQQMQLRGLAGLWRLAETNPESSLRKMEMREIMDMGTKEDVWYAGKVPDFRFLEPNELPKGALYGMTYKTVMLQPKKFLPWMKARLEDRGVKFVRTCVNSLGDLGGMGHDVLVNASGFGAEKLADVREADFVPNTMQVVVVKAPLNFNSLFVRRKPGAYSTAFARGDGTVWVGGILEQSRELAVAEEGRATICRNAHENNPDLFPSPKLEDWDILFDQKGRYPTMRPEVGVRCEKSLVGKQRVVHAYGPHAGGYVYSFGLARDVVNLVDEYVGELPKTAKL
ncbi:hypothetical protein BKA66DRAFT_538938 [Pyrenochaeta sp. MPI-SDFR-AT-0127]|nr:hypothetical protein BKA66DRAFT_538938 [Pyrenochaeta sp. MPI-SDFR-AT-0127]